MPVSSGEEMLPYGSLKLEMCKGRESMPSVSPSWTAGMAALRQRMSLAERHNESSKDVRCGGSFADCIPGQ